MNAAAQAEKQATTVQIANMDAAAAQSGVRWRRVEIVTDPAEIARIKARIDEDREAERRRERRFMRRLIRAWTTRTTQPRELAT